MHAGCDLYFPQGTSIHAVADGVVTRGPYAFYCETFALEVDHGSFLARYGEIQGKTEVTAGATIRAGQKSPGSGTWSVFRWLAICCTSNFTIRACRALSLWPVLLPRL